MSCTAPTALTLAGASSPSASPSQRAPKPFAVTGRNCVHGRRRWATASFGVVVGDGAAVEEFQGALDLFDASGPCSALVRKWTVAVATPWLVKRLSSWHSLYHAFGL